MDKREFIFDKLNNHFNKENEFPELSQISDEDINKIIALYEKEASKGGKDPWNYLYFDDLIIMQRCVYEIIKDKPEYSEITKKVEELYFDELDRRLQRSSMYYGEIDGPTYRSSYANMPEEAIVLADMCTRRIKEFQNNNSNMDDVSLEQMQKILSTYEEIETDFNKAGLSMPEEQNQIVQQMKMSVEAKKEQIKRELQEAIEGSKRVMEWAEQQPNVPEFTYTGNAFERAYDRSQSVTQSLNKENIPEEYQNMGDIELMEKFENQSTEDFERNSSVYDYPYEEINPKNGKHR